MGHYHYPMCWLDFPIREVHCNASGKSWLKICSLAHLQLDWSCRLLSFKYFGPKIHFKNWASDSWLQSLPPTLKSQIGLQWAENAVQSDTVHSRIIIKQSKISVLSFSPVKDVIWRKSGVTLLHNMQEQSYSSSGIPAVFAALSAEERGARTE